MGRIRTIKPVFFRHEGLFEAERETGLPMRVAFAGLWPVADREGRFRWLPRQLKLDVLPFDDLDFGLVLEVLESRGFIVRYTSGGEEYGCIPTWRRHQVINPRESASVLPAPPQLQSPPPDADTSGTREARVGHASGTREAPDADTSGTREARVGHASGTPPVHARGEGEGKGKGREEEDLAPEPQAAPIAAAGQPMLDPEKRKPVQAKSEAPTNATWAAYSEAYQQRYGAPPVRNKTVNGQLAHFVQRVAADEAPLVAAAYVEHNGSFYVQNGHSIGLMLRDAEKLRTEWATRRQITTTGARQADKTQSTFNAFAPLLAKADRDSTKGHINGE